MTKAPAAPRPARALRLIGAALILTSFALAMLHVQNNLNLGRMDRDGASTEAMIMQIVKGRLPDGSEGQAAMVEYQAEGTSWRAFERVSEAFVARYGEGDTLTIRYYVPDPRLTDLEYEVQRSWKDYALHLAGLAFALGLVLNLAAALRRPRK